MSTEKILKAWKDAEYRESLSEAERAQLPASPAGAVELTDGELEGVAGGRMPRTDGMSSTTDCYTTSCCK